MQQSHANSRRFSALPRAGAWRIAAAFAIVAASVIVTLDIDKAQADVPPAPYSEFLAPQCPGATNNDPTNNTEPGPAVPNLLRVWGGRLAAFNAGDPVILYNNSGRSGWSGPASTYASNPVCTVRFVAGVGEVSSWAYCTRDNASACSWTDADGDLVRSGDKLHPMATPPDQAPHLNDDEQRLQAYIAQHDLPIVPGTNWSGNVTAGGTASDATSASRTFRQDLIHCIDNPPTSGEAHEAFCNDNMDAATQARILEIVGAAPADQLALSTAAGTIVPGADGQVSVETTLAGLPLTVTVAGGTVTLCDPSDPVTLVGTTLTVDESATLPAVFDLCVSRPSDGTVGVSISGAPPVIANLGYTQSSGAVLGGFSGCQIFTLFQSEQRQTVVSSSSVSFAAQVTTTAPIATTSTTGVSPTSASPTTAAPTTVAPTTAAPSTSTPGITSTGGDTVTTTSPRRPNSSTSAGNERPTDRPGMPSSLAMTGSGAPALGFGAGALVLSGVALLVAGHRKRLSSRPA